MSPSTPETGAGLEEVTTATDRPCTCSPVMKARPPRPALRRIPWWKCVEPLQRAFAFLPHHEARNATCEAVRHFGNGFERRKNVNGHPRRNPLHHLVFFGFGVGLGAGVAGALFRDRCVSGSSKVSLKTVSVAVTRSKSERAVL